MRSHRPARGSNPLLPLLPACPAGGAVSTAARRRCASHIAAAAAELPPGGRACAACAACCSAAAGDASCVVGASAGTGTPSTGASALVDELPPPAPHRTATEIALSVPARNALADVFGFHRRGAAAQGQQRLALYGWNRPYPFLPIGW